jgi:hypothetical protein
LDIREIAGFVRGKFGRKMEGEDGGEMRGEKGERGERDSGG